MAATNHSQSLLVSVLWLAVHCGCRETAEPLGVAVHGNVRHGQSAHASGWVTFVPTDNRTSPRITADVVAGEYRLDRAAGLIPGSYEVLVGLTQGATASKQRVLAEPRTIDRVNSQEGPGSEDLGFQLGEFQIVIPDEETYEHDFVIE